jgi:hypothetical protein
VSGRFVDFVTDTLEEGKARGVVRKEVDARMIAWQFLGIGLTLDLMHLLGFKGEMDRARAEMWGRVYLDAVKGRGAHRRYANPERMPERGGAMDIDIAPAV